MIKIVKNTTGSTYNIVDTGIAIPAASQYTIPPQDFLLWAASSDVITGIGSGDLVINDGTFDLNINQGTDWILGNFPKSIEVIGSKTPLITNLALVSANTEYSFSIPDGTRQFTVKARGKSKLTFSYISGESASNFITIYPGAMYHVQRLDLTLTSLVLYIQATKDNEIAEIVSWT